MMKSITLNRKKCIECAHPLCVKSKLVEEPFIKGVYFECHYCNAAYQLWYEEFTVGPLALTLIRLEYLFDECTCG